MLSLGADSIIVCKKAELGPIDPTLVRATIGETAVPPQEIAVEDVNSFLSFVKERANINDQDAVANILISLINQIDPLTLGSVNRQHHHIRLVARKLLTSRKEKIDEAKIAIIIETLTEKIYSHGHCIGRKEAKDIGIPVKYPDNTLESILWELYLTYEDFLKIREPIHPEVLLKNKEIYEIENLPIAVIESTKKLHIFKTKVEFKKKRAIPSNPQINVNLGLQLPARISSQKLPKNVQQIINQLMEQTNKKISEIIQQEIIRQSPVIGIEGKLYGGKKKRI